MQSTVVCLPEPLGCFLLPDEMVPTQPSEAADEFLDECILSQPEVLAGFRTADTAGCFLCFADSLGEEE